MRGDKIAKRTLYGARDQLFALETYDNKGRWVEESLHDSEGVVEEWTRFENGSPVERKLYNQHEVAVDGNWQKAP